MPDESGPKGRGRRDFPSIGAERPPYLGKWALEERSTEKTFRIASSGRFQAAPHLRRQIRVEDTA